MTKIQARYDDFNPMIQRLLAMLAAVVEQQGKLRRQADVLSGGGWIGRGSERFYAEFYGYDLPALGKLEVALEETIKALRKAEMMLRDAEQEGANLFKNGGIALADAAPSQRDLLLARVADALKNRKLTPKEFLSLLGDGHGAGITDLVKELPGGWGRVIGLAFQLAESGADAQNLGQLMEQLAEGGTQFGIELGVEGGIDLALAGAGTTAMIANSVTQLAGKLSSGISGFIHDINPDPALADSIKHFDTTLENADLGSVTGGLSKVVIDLFQLGQAGQLSPYIVTPDPISAAISVATGLFKRPDLAQELAHNGLTFVGSVVDFGAGAVMLPHAAADMNADTLRVATHAAGQFFNLSPEQNAQLSNTVGTISQTLGDGLASGLVGSDPRDSIAEFNRLTGSTLPSTLDFSTWLGDLIPKP